MISLKKFLRSFVFAFRGLIYGLRTERNLKVHCLATIVVVLAGFYFHLSSFEWLIIILCIGLVFSAELINSSIENIADMLKLKFKLGYDDTTNMRNLAAAAVLVLAVVSFIVALVIFLPKMNSFYHGL
ncbi:MAG: diacylglycerol kinase family protein [Candidatus Shapirobacteria bacterium]